MDDVKTVVAQNIAGLRQANGMTQLELAEKLNYSDKAVSKWERGESMPDISVLVQIAALFNVSLDRLIREDGEIPVDPAQMPVPFTPKSRYRRSIITAMSVLLVWFLAVFVFVMFAILAKASPFKWLAFIYAIPVSAVVWLVLNSVWFNRRRNYLIISILMWSLLLSIHLTFFAFGLNVWPLYLLGIPGQVIILLWSVVKRRPAA